MEFLSTGKINLYISFGRRRLADSGQVLVEDHFRSSEPDGFAYLQTVRKFQAHIKCLQPPSGAHSCLSLLPSFTFLPRLTPLFFVHIIGYCCVRPGASSVSKLQALSLNTLLHLSTLSAVIEVDLVSGYSSHFVVPWSPFGVLGRREE